MSQYMLKKEINTKLINILLKLNIRIKIIDYTDANIIELHVSNNITTKQSEYVTEALDKTLHPKTIRYIVPSLRWYNCITRNITIKKTRIYIYE